MTTADPKGDKGKKQKTPRLNNSKKRKRDTQKAKQGRQEICTRIQQAMRKEVIRIQIIPPTEAKQPDTIQPELKLNNTKLYVPNRNRSENGKYGGRRQ